MNTLDIWKLEKRQDKIMNAIFICVIVGLLSLIFFIAGWVFKQCGVDNIINGSLFLIRMVVPVIIFLILVFVWFEKKIKKEKSQEPRPSDSEWITTDDGEA